MRPDEGKERRAARPRGVRAFKALCSPQPSFGRVPPTTEGEATMSTATAVTAGPPRQRPDIQVQDYGSLVLLRAVSSAGRHWLDDHVRQHAYQPFPAGTLVCEPGVV
jgi:hypothetical protein